MKAAKGSAFEREVCGKLSMWFSKNLDDSWFWRTAGSGGRATNRKKKGKTTQGHAGDITNTCSEGAPFIQAITVEIKRGYSKTTIHDLLDRPDKAVTREFEGFILQAKEAAKTAGTRYWMLIHRRDSRQAMVYIPCSLTNAFFQGKGIGLNFLVSVSFSFVTKNRRVLKVDGFLLDDFLETASPDVISYL